MSRKSKIDIATLTGQQFSLLTIQHAWRDQDNHIIVKCLCNCGKRWTGKLNAIKSFKTRSCGCKWNAIRKLGGLGYCGSK